MLGTTKVREVTKVKMLYSELFKYRARVGVVEKTLMRGESC